MACEGDFEVRFQLGGDCGAVGVEVVVESEGVGFAGIDGESEVFGGVRVAEAGVGA